MGFATQEQADAIFKCLERDERQRIEDMPDDAKAIHELNRAYKRLCEMGWQNAIYCPKDGTVFEVIEAGSTGVHDCIYEGEWPKGSWWVLEDADMCPSRPILFRLKPDDKGPLQSGEKE